MMLLPLSLDYDRLVDSLIENNYPEEFCLALSFEPVFIGAMMDAGFLVMSLQNGQAVLLPKLHLERSVLFFSNLHIPKSVRPLLTRYTLKPFDALPPIMDACIATHGEDWLTKPLRETLYKLEWSPKSLDQWSVTCETGPLGQGTPPYNAFCSAFGLYRDSELVAGEFGAFCRGVYTSYSGFFRENSAGTVQMILTARFLEEQGFAFWDLGMPLEYKSRLGAVSLDRKTFIEKFRQARQHQPLLQQRQL